MEKQKLKAVRRKRRKTGIRKRVIGTPERPRLTVFRSLKRSLRKPATKLRRETAAVAMIVERDESRQLVLYWFHYPGVTMANPSISKLHRLKRFLHGRLSRSMVKVQIGAPIVGSVESTIFHRLPSVCLNGAMWFHLYSVKRTVSGVRCVSWIPCLLLLLMQRRRWLRRKPPMCLRAVFVLMS